MAIESNRIEVEVDGGIATLWLNRPENANVIDLKLVQAMRSACFDLEERADIKVIVLRGRGKQFCGGGDIGMFRDNLDTMGRFIKDVIADFHEIVLSLRKMPMPVVAVVHGAVAGGGLSLALACDFVIAVEGTKFATAYRNIGASTDGGMTHLLTRLVGTRKALELLLHAGQFSPEEALSLGLINRVVAADALDTELDKVCSVFAGNARAATAVTKRLVYQAPTATFDTQLGREMAGFAEVAQTKDFKEGVTAFAERRKPNFSA